MGVRCDKNHHKFFIMIFLRSILYEFRVRLFQKSRNTFHIIAIECEKETSIYRMWHQRNE